MKMKRSYSIIIAVCLIFVLSGCTSNNNDPNKTGQGTNEQTNNNNTNTTQDKNNQGGGNETDTNGTNTHETGNTETSNNGTGTYETSNNENGTHETNSTQTSETQANDVISEKEAKQIALEKVPGAVESDIKNFHVENKKNFVEYEGEIVYNGKEYEFEIDGHDGTILEWEVEDVKKNM